MDSIEGVPEILPLSLKNLGDKSDDRRKAAAQEINLVVTKFQNEGNVDKVKKVLVKLSTDYLKSPLPNYRNGALSAIASIAIALGSCFVDYFPIILEPVLKCLEDSDSKVRYYASESLYNIAKAVHSGILPYFDQFLYAACQLFADNDTYVKKGGSLLDRALKDIISECQEVNVSKFIPILKQYILLNNPFIRRLAVSWISVLDNKPGFDMLEYFPQLMEGLFKLLGDEHREIRQETDDILSSFLSEIKSTVLSDVAMNTMMSILLSLIHNNDPFIRLTVVTWIYEFLLLDSEWTVPYAKLLRALLPVYGDFEKEVATKAKEACMELIRSLRKKGKEEDLIPLLDVVCMVLSKKQTEPCLVCLEVVNVLLETRGKEVIENEHLKAALLEALKESDDVIEDTLKVLVKYVEYSQDLSSLITSILDMLKEDEQYLEERGCLIVRTICKYMNTETVFPLLADIIQKYEDRKFASLFIQMMNVILLTAEETSQFCRQLRSCFSTTHPKPDGQKLFDRLFPAWCINPFATLSLCWLTESYAIAYEITQSLAQEEISISMLLQADKLVQLLESPVFVHVRLQLLNTSSPSIVYLLQSLYGLLMILPQSSAYRLLQNRLSGITPLHVIMQNTTATYEITEEEKKRIETYTNTVRVVE